METVFNENWNCFRESKKLPPYPPSLFSSRHPSPNSLIVFQYKLLFFLPVVAGISTVWWHRTVLEPDKWIFNQLHGRILRPSVPSQVQQQNDRDVLSFRYHSSVHWSVQYVQKVYGCCGGFFVTVNLIYIACTCAGYSALPIKVKKSHRDIIIRTPLWISLIVNERSRFHGLY